MKNSNKKGFTIVELVIVIAVIAILAAVLIPTFSGLVKKANLSSDKQAVRNMNMALAADEAKNGKPANLTQAHAVLSEAGYRDKLTPVTAGCDFVWNKTYNIIMLVDTTEGEDSQSWKLIYPEDDAEAKDVASLKNFSETYTLSNYANAISQQVTNAINDAKANKNGVLEIANDETTNSDDITFSKIVTAAAKNGESFAGVTINLPSGATVKVDIEDAGGRINNLEGRIHGNGATVIVKNIQAMHDTSKAANASGYLYTTNYDDGVEKQKVGTAFINYLGTGAVVKDLKIKYEQDKETQADPKNKYTYFGGIVGCLDGGTIENCEVSGHIMQFNRVGGIVGTALSGTIKNCSVTNLTIKCRESTADSTHQYTYAGGIVAFAGDSNLTSAKTLTIDNCTVTEFTVEDASISGALIGWVSYADTKKNAIGITVNITNCTLNGFTANGVATKRMICRVGKLSTVNYDESTKSSFGGASANLISVIENNATVNGVTK